MDKQIESLREMLDKLLRLKTESLMHTEDFEDEEDAGELYDRLQEASDILQAEIGKLEYIKQNHK